MEQTHENILRKTQESTVAKEDHGEKVQLIVFRLGTEQYALHIDQIREVVPTPSVARLPQSPDFVRGVANIRGNIIAIIDLEICLGLSAADDSIPDAQKKPYTLVLESAEYKMGVLVSEVPNTLNINSKQMEDTGGLAAHDHGQSSYIKGLIKKEEELIIYFDAIQLVANQQWSKQASYATN